MISTKKRKDRKITVREIDIAEGAIIDENTREILKKANANADAIYEVRRNGGECYEITKTYICYELSKIYEFNYFYYVPLTNFSDENSPKNSTTITLEGEYELDIEFMEKLRDLILQNKEIKDDGKYYTAHVIINDKSYKAFNANDIEIILEKVKKNPYEIWLNLCDDGILLMSNYRYDINEYIKNNGMKTNYLESIYYNKVEHQGDLDKIYDLTEEIIIISPIIYKPKYHSTAKSIFSYFTNVKTIENIENFITPELTDMSNMFKNCKNLESIDFSKVNTSNVVNMSNMFYSCSSLEYINISNFDTSNVVSMAGMFGSCSSLKYVDVSNFDTSNVVNVSNMFYSCSSLEYIDVSSFDMSNVNDISQMFMHCTKLKQIKLFKIEKKQGIKDYAMFIGCDSLKDEPIY